MTTVMIAGLPGKMASLVVDAVEENEDFNLIPIALAKEEGGWQSRLSSGITLVPLERHEENLRSLTPDVVVDFTAPSAVNRNAELYCKCDIPFVMGTTGGDRELLKKTVECSKTSAVIAPNMAKEIVVLLAMMEYAAKTFPNSFEGYRLVIRESHQQGKKDTSGTAKAMVQHFNVLGIPFTADQIVMERDPLIQEVAWGVPREHLAGHAYHEYTLLSEDGTVLFQIRHNVNGRTIYIPLILRSIRFLNKAVQGGAQGIAFSAIDVLKS